MAESEIGRRALLYALAVAVGIAMALLAGELFLRFVDPVATICPRWRPSPQYGHVLYENTTMRHEMPGRWRFRYRINRYGYRGAAVPIADRYDATNIVVLGDSHSFGQGVRDGEEYPSVLGDCLGEGYNVINLAVGGYGLTQELRRYYEFGTLYRPSIIILQFSDNDPEDNIYSRVARVESGRLVFENVQHPFSGLKRMLSTSLVQKSQLYNLARYLAYTALRRYRVENVYRGASEKGSRNTMLDTEEFYNSLLDVFTGDLHERGVRLIMIATDDDALNSFPAIKHHVTELERNGYLDYLDTTHLFGRDKVYPPSPEGHPWGTEAHRQLGHSLAGYIHVLAAAPYENLHTH